MKLPNKKVQATPMNAAVLPLRSRAGLCHRYGVLTIFVRRTMNISDAQREVRFRFHGGFYGQLVSGVLWLLSGCLAVTVGVKGAIIALVFGGFLIFPATESLVRLSGMKPLTEANTLRYLGMQVAFVLPFSMLLLLPVTLYRTNLFYPAMMILLGAHYIPFVFLYGMRLFAFLAAILIGGGVCIAMFGANTFSTDAWSTGMVLALLRGALWCPRNRDLTT